MNSPNFKQAHPLAQRLMDEDFYYSPFEEIGPFVSDDGADTFAGFSSWRPANPQESPLVYLQQQLRDWNYPPFDLYQRDTVQIEQYIQQHEIEITLLVGMDATIIALAFGQLYLEGEIDEQLRELAKISIDRQLHPELIFLWDEGYRPTRQEQLSKMLSVLNRL